jgi:CHAP domain
MPGTNLGKNPPVNPYVFGDCTWYIKQRFPGLYGYLGNAGTWMTSGAKQGYKFSQTPKANTVMIMQPTPSNGVAQAGHVAVVDSVNSNGSFWVSEMNWAGWDHVDERLVTRKPGDGIVGFMVPPGANVAITPADVTNKADVAGACITKVNLGPVSFCADGLIGGAAMTAGGAIMLSGTLVLVATALSHSKVGQAAGGAARAFGGPVGKVASIPAQRSAARQQRTASAAQAQRQAETDAHQGAIRRAQVRTARARARVVEGRARDGSDEDKERTALRAMAAKGQRGEPGTVKRRLQVA